MFRDGSSSSSANPHPSTRSLLDRVGGPAGPSRNGNMPNGFAHEDIQSRIDDIVNSSPDPNMMMPGGFPVMGGAGGMDMNAMAGMGNPLMLQEMMMNQMAMMAQMASSMGMMNGAPGQFGFPGVMPGDMGMLQGAGMSNGFQGSAMGGNGNGMNNNGRGRGGARGGRGVGRGRGSGALRAKSPDVATTKDISATPQSSPIIITEPTPTVPVTPSFPSAPLQRTGFVVPERPQSPTLCKFGLKCTNAHCRYAHPSPVATAESGVVLSNEACEKGKDCQDKDCIKSHVSPAVLNPQGLYHTTSPPDR
jgi:nuclear polyadenylated RNA-binding protein NAB2